MKNENCNAYFDYWNSRSSGGTEWYINNHNNWPFCDKNEDEQWLIKFLEKQRSIKTVLDVACGSGRLFPTLSKLNSSAIEFSESLFPLALKNQYKIPVYKKDIRHELLAKTFDLVFCTQVLLHIPPSHIENTINNMWSMTKKYMVIVTWAEGCKGWLELQPMLKDREDITAPQNSFAHDYYKIFKKLDISFEEEMVSFKNGTNNKIFIAKRK